MNKLISVGNPKTTRPTSMWKTITDILLFSVIFFALWIRIQGVERIPTGQFTEIDAYHYQRQSDLIAEQGYLPARDMNRWLPHGRDNKQLLPFYAYAIAYTHKAVAWLFPELTRYHIQLYAPTVCFVIGLAVLFLFLTRIYGLFFAFIVGILLATLPGGVERSAAGFGDRDAFYWMFGVLAVISYLWKMGGFRNFRVDNTYHRDMEILHH